MNHLKKEASAVLDVDRIRKDFPLLSRTVHNKPLVYLDNGATAQKPVQVIAAIDQYYRKENANIHRGVHTLSREITIEYEAARNKVKDFINAEHAHEIIFTSGTTASINLVAHSFCSRYLHEGDEIVITAMEHHSNILPWQMACESRGARLRVVPINDEGELIMDEYALLLNDRTRLVAVAHVSNTLGTINPVEKIIELAHGRNIPVLLDGAQAVPHMAVDVRSLDADFYCFSGHKLFGPTGTGILYGKEKWLNEMPPYQTGGGTIKTVSFDRTEYADLPLKFGAGTPHISGGIGLGAAIDYVNAIGYTAIEAYEKDLLEYATRKILALDGIRIIGTSAHKAGVISLVADGVHPFDLGTLLDQLGIAVRTGHHCTQPLMERYCIPGTVRISFCFYNTFEEVDILVDGLSRALSMLR